MNERLFLIVRCHKCRQVHSERGEWLSWRLGQGETPIITLPSAARVGWYAARLRKTTQ